MELCSRKMPDTIRIEHCAKCGGDTQHIRHAIGQWVCKPCNTKPINSKAVTAYLAKRRRAIEDHMHTEADYWGEI